MTEGLDDAYKENIISFNAVNVEESYDFAKDLLAQYVEPGYRSFKSYGLLEHMGAENGGRGRRRV